MAPLLISIRRLILFHILIQSASLYKIYAVDDKHSDLLRNPLSYSMNNDMKQALPIKNLGYVDEDIDFDTDSDENKDNSALWLSSNSKMKEQEKSLWKRATFPIKLRSSNALPQRRNNRPHWNPLVAAYKRCGELLRREERESCFKDAIQMLFVHKLRK